MKIFQNLKSKRLFYRILLLLLAMAFLMFLLVFFFVHSYLSESYKARSKNYQEQLLMTASEYADMALMDLGRAMRSVLWNTEITRAVLVPELITYHDKTEIVKTLSSFETDYPLVESAALLSYHDGILYDEQGNIGEIRESPSRRYLKEFHSQAVQTRLVEEDFSIQVISVDGQVALLVDFPTPETNGALLVEVDRVVLFHFLEELMDRPSDDMAVRSPSGDLIYRVGPLEDAGREAGFTAVYTGNTGWKFGIRVHSDKTGLDWKATLQVFGVWAIVFAGISAAAAVFVTLTIYDPIHKLHSFVGERGETATGKGETELDTVRRIYATTLEKKDNLIQEVEAMAPIVRERFYKNLLMGREFTDSFLEERLHQLGGRLGKEGRYLVFAGGLTEDFPGDTEAVMGTLCQRIGGRAEPFEEPVILEPILMDDASLVLIACLPDEWTDRQIQEWKMKTAEQVVALSEQCGAKHSFLISAGGVCRGIQNLPRSYQEAKTDFRYQRYHWDQEEEETETGGESYPEILDPAVSGDWKRAYACLDSLLARIRGDLSDEGKTRARYEELISALAEQLLILHATEEKMQLFEPYHRSAQRDDLALLEQVVRETGRQAIDSLGYYGQKSKNRYIRQAREYIEEHSGDSSLSLDLVAEKVGINSAYLSRLFCEICGMNFVSYVNQCRVERAQLLLRQTKIPVKEIGFKTGFNSLQNFSRVFKRHMNMTPGAYRKQEQA